MLLTEPVGTLLREAAVRSKIIGLVRVLGPLRLLRGGRMATICRPRSKNVKLNVVRLLTSL